MVMPSITSWTRLEPDARNETMASSLQARIHDPAWLLARQWQFGEFQGEDAGTPVVARWRADRGTITRYFADPHSAGTSDGVAYDDSTISLGTIVTREAMHTRATWTPRLAAEA